MLDLVAEVAGHEVQQAAALQVARTLELTQVPVAAGFILQRAGRENGRLLGKVAAEDHGEGPQVADQVGHHIAGQHGQGIAAQRQGQQGEHQIVLDPLTAHLGIELAQQRAHLLAADAALEHLVQAQVLDGHGVLEQQRLQRHPQGLPAVVGFPALFGEQAHHAVTDVVIHAQHVGISVMNMVVGVPPEIRGAGDIPLIGAPGQFRIVHPVVLAVHHVMPQLHVLDDLAQAQQQRAQQPGRREPAGQQKQATTPATGPHHGPHAADITGIGLAQISQGTLAQGIQFGAEGVDLLAAQFAVFTHAATLLTDRRAHRRAAR